MSNFADAERVVNASVTVRIVTAAVGRASVSASRLLPRIAGLKGPHYAAVIIAGIVTHAILLQFVPDRLAPVKPLAYWMVVAFAALVVGVFHTTRNSSTAIADSAAGTANTKKSS